MNNRVVVSKRMLLINSASSVATRALSISVLIWVQQYLIKHIPVEEYSILPLIYSLMTFLPILTVILTSGTKRYVVAAYAAGDDKRIEEIVSTLFPMLCIAAAALAGIGALLAWKIDSILRIEPKYVSDAQTMFLLIVLLESLRLPLSAFINGIYAKQRFVVENFIKISCECLRIAFLFALLLGVSVSVLNVVISTVTAGVLEIVSLSVVSVHLLPSQKFFRHKFELNTFYELIKFGSWSSLYGVAGMIRKSADPIILNRLATPLDVTCFHLGALIPNRLEIIMNQSVLGSVAPVVVGLETENKREKLQNLYLRLGRMSMWGALLIIAPFLAHSHEIVTLYVGGNYVPAASVMFLLLACYPIVYANILHTTLANAKLRMRSLALRETLASIINILLTLILVGHFKLGALGSAAATFIVYGLGSILLFWPFGMGMVGATWRETWDKIVFPGIVPFISAIGAMKLLNQQYPVDSWVTVGLNAIMGTVIYLIAIMLVAKRIDKDLLHDALQKVLSNFAKRTKS